MSFIVVTKGPVATAGSTLTFFSINGIAEPTIVAKTMIIISETDRIAENKIPLLNRK